MKVLTMQLNSTSVMDIVAYGGAAIGMAASDKIFKILDLPESQAGEKCLPDGALDVSLKDVHFSYEADREILKGINLNLSAGCFVSLVGESGCGKSTIAGILAAKNRGYTGEISIGGEPLSDIADSNRSKVAKRQYKSMTKVAEV